MGHARRRGSVLRTGLLALLTVTMAISPAAVMATSHCPGFPSNPDGCVEPPEDMVAWWSFDEPDGAIAAADLAGGHHAKPDGDPVSDPGMVANAWTFDHTDDMVRAPHDLSLNPGLGDISIDAWVRTDGFEGYQTIVDKRGLVDVTIETYLDQQLTDDATQDHESTGAVVHEVGTFTIEVIRPWKDLADLLIDDITSNVPAVGPQVRGYHFFIEHGTLKFQLNVGSLPSTYTSGVQLTDGAWHHVAVTVDRTNTHTGTFYVDGSPVATFSTPNQQGSLDNFASVTLGRFQMESTNRDGWDLDEVELFHRVLDPQEIASLYNAGEAGKCKLDCTTTEEEGILLDGSGADPRPGLEPAFPNAERRDVDEGGVNKVFIHTFDGLAGNILAAKLKIRVEAQGELDYNDAIGLQYTGTQPRFEWWSRIGSTYSAQGLLPSEWDHPDDHTFTIDLAALEYRGQPVNLVDSMNTHRRLDVMVQDDTKVHFVELILLRCCDNVTTETIQDGVPDEFDPILNSPEESSPRQVVEDWIKACETGYTMRFDETSKDKCFGHTFDFAPRCIANATLEIRLKALDELVSTDLIQLGYDDASGTWLWEAQLQDLPEIGSSWNTGDTATVTIDVGTKSALLLESMSATGRLDIVVRDDTSVDYATLILQDCCG